jgi:hypothetical protein
MSSAQVLLLLWLLLVGNDRVPSISFISGMVGIEILVRGKGCFHHSRTGTFMLEGGAVVLQLLLL